MIDPYLDDSFTAPVRSDEIKRADLIAITHGHFDHVLDVGRLANRLGSTVICSEVVSRTIQNRLGVSPGRIQTVTAGEVLRRSPFTVEVVKAVHVDNRVYFAEQFGLQSSAEVNLEEMVRRVFNQIPEPKIKEKLLAHIGKFPPGEQLNYRFHFPGNLGLYFFGSVPDPELFSLAEESRAQVLILQLLRGKEEEAVEIARRCGARVVFPSHHDAFFPGQKVPDLDKVKSLFQKYPQVRFVETEAGKWYEIDTVVQAL